MILKRDRVIAALSRFDAATVEDVATALHRNNPHQQRNVWALIQKLVGEGLASRDGGRGRVATYALTDEGRALLKKAA